jgi:SAM-dependent methyltransferase
MRSPQFELHADIEEKHWWFRGRRKIMQTLVRQILPPSRTNTVIDLGCGTGGNIAALASEYLCVGIDSSEEAIELARLRFPQVRFICGSFTADGSADGHKASFLLLMDVLEHVPDDFLLFSEVLSVCRPGSHLLITVPADMALWSKHDESFGHYRRYDTRRLELVWKGLPVTPLLVSYFNARLYPIIRLTRILTRILKRPFGRAGTDFRIPSPLINKTLEGLFAGEARALVEAINSGGATGFSRGASLIALLRRENGTVPLRTAPAELPPDPSRPGRSHES